MNKILVEWIDKNNKISGFILRSIMDEYIFATNKFGAFHTAHEGIGIILEEFEELKKEVFKKQGERTRPKMRREAIQLATMAIRFVSDICDNDTKWNGVCEVSDTKEMPASG